MHAIKPTGEEINFDKDEIIVTKTDTKGRITYVNDVFCKVAEMTTSECIGEQHSLIRHPDMPRAVFKLLWDVISSGQEMFAYVKNISMTGKYYWVFAHVTPSFDASGEIIGYHSNRRFPPQKAVNAISDIYKTLIQEEQKHSNPKDGLNASYELLVNMLKDEGKSYSEFIWSLGK